MFFWSNSELKEKLKEKDEEISTLHLAIEELNQEHAEKLKCNAKEIEKLNRKLDIRTKELKALNDELEKYDKC